MKTCFQIAECNLSYAKIATFCKKQSPFHTKSFKERLLLFIFRSLVPAARRLPAPGVFGIYFAYH